MWLGKRARQEANADDFPPTPFWEALADEGLTIEIQRRWILKRDEAVALQRAADVSFDDVSPMARRSKCNVTAVEAVRRLIPPKNVCVVIPNVGNEKEEAAEGRVSSSWEIPRHVGARLSGSPLRRHKGGKVSSKPNKAVS